jgi:O-succinylbenzoate synthase
MGLHSGRPMEQRVGAFGSLDGSVELLRAEVVEVRLPLLVPVATAVGTHRMRPVVLVRLECAGPDGTVFSGWGECAALGETTYDREDVAVAWSTLTDHLVPGLIRTSGGDGRLPAPVELEGYRGVADRPLAQAALEMGVADAHLRAGGRSFASLLGVEGQVIQPGAVIGLPVTAEQLSSDLLRLHDAGYARVKIKIAPGLEPLVDRAVRPLVGSGLIVQLDANGAYGSDAAERLGVLDDLGLACIEQPLGRYDFEGHRQLAADLATPICLDESLDSPATVVEAVDGGACSVVCVKPARLGGIGAALEAISWCDAHAIPFTPRAFASWRPGPAPGVPGRRPGGARARHDRCQIRPPLRARSGRAGHGTRSRSGPGRALGGPTHGAGRSREMIVSCRFSVDSLNFL